MFLTRDNTISRFFYVSLQKDSKYIKLWKFKFYYYVYLVLLGDICVAKVNKK